MRQSCCDPLRKRGKILDFPRENFHIYPVHAMDEGLAILAETVVEGRADNRCINQLITEHLKRIGART
jgi:hypothetical protein